MKILFLTPGCFDKGGISRYSRYQMSALGSIFGESQVRTLSLLGPEEHGFEDPLDVQWHGNGVSIPSKLRFVTTALVESILWQPDVIHCAHVNLSGLAVLLGMACKAKTLLNTYGLEVWSGLSHDALWGLQKSDVVLSDCHATASFIESKGWRGSSKIPVLWDCVDLDKFFPAPCPVEVKERYGLPREGKIILTLGRLSHDAEYKGYERLLDAFSSVADQLPNTSLVYGGRGDLCIYLKQKALLLGVSDKVFFTGSIDEKDLADVYRSASIFSLISDSGEGRGEGLPLTPLEAMACGVPVLVGNRDGSREAVVGGRGGVVLDPFDLDLHAATLMSLSNDSSLRLAMSAEAHANANEFFSFGHFKNELRRIYDETIT